MIGQSVFKCEGDRWYFFCHGGLAARDEAGQEQESVRRVASDHILHDHTYIYIYAPHHRRNPGREGGSAARVYFTHPEIPVATPADPPGWGAGAVGQSSCGSVSSIFCFLSPAAGAAGVVRD